MTTQLEVNHGDTLDVVANGTACGGTVTINGASYRDPAHPLLQVAVLIHQQPIDITNGGQQSVKQQGTTAQTMGNGQLPGSWTVDLAARFQDGGQCTNGANYLSVLAEYANPADPVQPETELVANVGFTGVPVAGGGGTNPGDPSGPSGPGPS
jgi:hypothetical protein